MEKQNAREQEQRRMEQMLMDMQLPTTKKEKDKATKSDCNVIYFLKFFLSGFFSRTLTINRTAGEGRGPSFIPLYHFHPLTNIQTFICNFAREMSITYF